MNKDGLDIPQADGRDVAHIAISTMISAVPFLGGAELLKFIVTPSLEKRREEWMEVVRDAIRELRERELVDIDALRDNEEFITLLLNATQAALKTHFVEKRQMLKNAIVNFFSTKIRYDVATIYVDLIERLTPTHVAMLKFISENREEIGYTQSIDDAYQVFKDVLYSSDILLNIEKYEFRALFQALDQSGLILLSEGYLLPAEQVNSPSLMAYEDSGTSLLPYALLTSFGIAFMSFIEQSCE
ncbi:hypothetical protein F1C16_03075 [Hymenobacter sp. NBH84]|uniref:hypothetical protein n=1 Tax=Hymenobacter sp. NBH84 TaxID=2596915 RepID=UPI00162994D9|nr:hypothetical protein [Hymenobacter sp. NBH84]QNE38606.1 hypothetical protein F1C16_03075 [Hymenobacter sp. NBH84]